MQIEYLQEQINLKADKTALDRLQLVVDKKANNDYVANLESTIYNKADKTSLNNIEDRINALNKSLTNYVTVESLKDITGDMTDVNAKLSKKADKTALDELSETVQLKADVSQIDEINKKFESIDSIDIEGVDAKLSSLTLSVDKLNKKMDTNSSDLKKKADLSYVERIDTDLKRATTKLDIIVETKADKTELLGKANKSDLEALSNTNIIINNNISQLRKSIDTKASKSDLEARVNELQHAISDLYTIEKNDIRLVNSKIINLEKNITRIDESVSVISKANKDWIQVLTPEQYKRLPTSRIDPAKLYMCIKYGKPYALYIGTVLIAERNVEESTSFAYTFPLTF